jgi:hypothetical protein
VKPGQLRSRPLSSGTRLRSTPLKRGKPLQCRTPLKRLSPLRPRSGKTARIYVTRRALVAALLAERPWCEVRWDAGCQGRSVDVHEPGMRSRGADICDPAACAATCRYCHDVLHAHPAEATKRGWLIPSGKRGPG